MTSGRIEDMGLNKDVLEALARERASENGSTTLVRQLERLCLERGAGVSIMTVEDPIEYRILGNGIVQMPVEGAA